MVFEAGSPELVLVLPRRRWDKTQCSFPCRNILKFYPGPNYCRKCSISAAARTDTVCCTGCRTGWDSSKRVQFANCFLDYSCTAPKSKMLPVLNRPQSNRGGIWKPDILPASAISLLQKCKIIFLLSEYSLFILIVYYLGQGLYLLRVDTVPGRTDSLAVAVVKISIIGNPKISSHVMTIQVSKLKQTLLSAPLKKHIRKPSMAYWEW